MPLCPFAQQVPISGSAGDYKGGPFRIVHHTTEGSTAQAAMDAYRAKRADPHFTVDDHGVRQHIDTAVAARALRHPGTIETNLESAVQIETVGFAGRPKSNAALLVLARLCRWIEATHDVPRAWPNGPPKPAIDGADPGGHDRNAAIWTATAGHYGHSNVPDNVHWDPGYSPVEAAFLLAAEFDPGGNLTNAGLPAVKALIDRQPVADITEAPFATMIDHFDVGDRP